MTQPLPPLPPLPPVPSLPGPDSPWSGPAVVTAYSIEDDDFDGTCGPVPELTDPFHSSRFPGAAAAFLPEPPAAPAPPPPPPTPRAAGLPLQPDPARPDDPPRPPPPPPGRPGTALHHQVAAWGGMPGECGAECACGLTYDGFDSIAEAGAHLDRHIADESTRIRGHADRLTYEQRVERYCRQNNGAPLTNRQWRRIGKKIDRAFYRELRGTASPPAAADRHPALERGVR